MLKNSFYAKKPLRLLSYICLFSVLLFLFNGCQKNDKVKQEKTEQQKNEEVLKWISEQKTTSFFVQGGKIIDSYRTDLEGNRVNFSAPQQHITLRTGPGCYVDEPSDLFEGINFSEDCDSSPKTFSAVVSFVISSDNAIILRNPNQPNSTANANQTRGRLRITNNAGTTVLYDQQNIISTVVITDLGVDPNIPENHRYRITYNATNIPEAAITTENTVNRTYISYFTECEEQSVYSYNLIGAYGNATGLSACNVVNKVYINPSFPSISGVAACLCCVPALYSNRHDIEIYNSTGTTLLWYKTITAVQTVYIPTSSGSNIGDGWVPPNSTVKIRYRNRQVNTSTGVTECVGGWLVIPETWFF
ncbi:MAG: hypothetical protein K2Q24_06020 [Chitinophagaceae bacterium]|jgi:hypothetical protein|nr:hypothetical protein [Chitinophagaceae bacterium]